MKVAQQTFVWLLFIGVSGCSRPEPIDLVRLTDLWVAASAARTGPPPQTSIGSVTRIGIPIRVGEEERIQVVIPEDAELRGFVGVVSGSAEVAHADWHLEIVECGREDADRASRTPIARVTASAMGWTPLLVDLAMWTRKNLELCLVPSSVNSGQKGAAEEAYLWLAGATIAQRGVPHKASREPNLILVTEQATLSSAAKSTPSARPNLARLTQQSEFFSNALMNSSAAGPAHGSLLSGLHPRELPTLANLGISDKASASLRGLPARVRSLPELLWALGFATAGIVSDRALDSESGFAQGFDLFDARDAHADSDRLRSPVGSITERALSWIEEAPGSFFLFLNFATSPESHDTLESGLGRIMEYLAKKGIYETTMIVVVSNDGIGREDPSPGDPLSDRVLRRSFIVKYPRSISARRVGARYRHRVDSLDLRASIVREMGLRDELERRRSRTVARCSFCFTRQATTGTPVEPGLYGLHEGRSYHFVEHRGESEATNLEAVYHENWKLVRDDLGNHWLRDLTKDPLESRDFAELKPAMTMELNGALDAWGVSQPRDAPIEDLGKFSAELADFFEEHN